MKKHKRMLSRRIFIVSNANENVNDKFMILRQEYVILSETKNIFADMYGVSAVRRGRRTLQCLLLWYNVYDKIKLKKFEIFVPFWLAQWSI